MIDLRPHDRFYADIGPFSQGQINAFGDLMGANGRIHTDPEFALTTPAQGTVVQGGLVIAPLHDALCQVVGEERWLNHGTLDAKLIAFTRPDDSLRLDLRVDNASRETVDLSFSITNAAGVKVVVGEVHVGG